MAQSKEKSYRVRYTDDSIEEIKAYSFVSDGRSIFFYDHNNEIKAVYYADQLRSVREIAPTRS